MHDVVVIGAGPAGLAAGVAARQLGAEVLILDQGKPLISRSRADRESIVSGVGGAGLYSDGKFSFFPSATALWAVEPRHCLLSAYIWLTGLLASAGLTVPPFPVDNHVNNSLKHAAHRKEYPSYYLPIEQRVDLLHSLSEAFAGSIRVLCRVAAIDHRSDRHIRFLDSDGAVRAEARSAVLALGRLGPVSLRGSLPSSELKFRRVELGVRIEQPADKFVLANDPNLDTKIIGASDDGLSWRTFCCCRDGLVVAGSSSGILSVSGRADCPPTGKSNVGLLVRFTNADAGMTAWQEALCVQPLARPIAEPISEVIGHAGRLRINSKVANVIGSRAASHLVRGLNDLTDFTGRRLSEATVYAPAIEGVGLYPRIGLDLRIPGRPIFVAGDLTGMFRGLTAALLSGFVAGSAAALAAIATSA